MDTREYRIEGMGCNHCLQTVRKALESIGGITVDAVEIGSARIETDNSKASDQAIREAIEAAGYKVVEQHQ